MTSVPCTFCVGAWLYMSGQTCNDHTCHANFLLEGESQPAPWLETIKIQMWQRFSSGEQCVTLLAELIKYFLCFHCGSSPDTWHSSYWLQIFLTVHEVHTCFKYNHKKCLAADCLSKYFTKQKLWFCFYIFQNVTTVANGRIQVKLVL